MFEDPEWEVLRPERSIIKEIEPASDRLQKCKSRTLKLLQEATERV